MPDTDSTCAMRARWDRPSGVLEIERLIHEGNVACRKLGASARSGKTQLILGTAKPTLRSPATVSTRGDRGPAVASCRLWAFRHFPLLASRNRTPSTLCQLIRSTIGYHQAGAFVARQRLLHRNERVASGYIGLITANFEKTSLQSPHTGDWL